MKNFLIILYIMAENETTPLLRPPPTSRDERSQRREERRQKVIEQQLLQREGGLRGHLFVYALYKTLFADIWTGNGLDTIPRRERTQCFENGAFLFSDSHQRLFSELLTGPDIGIIKPWGGTAQFLRLRSLSHFVPSKLISKQRPNKVYRSQPWLTWHNVKFIFHTIHGDKVVNWGDVNPFKNIEQYERRILPQIKFLCNPQCEKEELDNIFKTDGNPNNVAFCGGNIGKTPKRAIKFYCYSIEYFQAANTTTSRTDGPYTYVKIEETPVSNLATKAEFLKHSFLFSKKFSTKGKMNKDAVSKMRGGHCFRKSNSDYCYRAEDYGWTPTQPGAKRDYNRKYNNVGRLGTEDAREIEEYFATRPALHGQSVAPFRLRIGHEMFVPKNTTNLVIHNYRIILESCLVIMDGTETSAGRCAEAAQTLIDYTTPAPHVEAITGGRRRRRKKTRKGKRKKKKHEKNDKGERGVHLAVSVLIANISLNMEKEFAILIHLNSPWDQAERRLFPSS